MLTSQRGKNAIEDFQKYISGLENQILYDFNGFKPVKSLHLYLSVRNVEGKVTYMIDKTLPESIKIILECAFNMFMYEYRVNDKTIISFLS
jgi:hypothetical protein